MKSLREETPRVPYVSRDHGLGWLGQSMATTRGLWTHTIKHIQACVHSMIIRILHKCEILIDKSFLAHGPSSVRPSVVRPSLATMLKHLFIRNRLADQSQILCGASLGRGNEILFAASGSHDQDGCHAHIW